MTAFRNWRQKKHIPLKQIAGNLGISVSTVGSWEQGERFPKCEHLQALANYMGVPPCRLFCVKTDKCGPTECSLAPRESSS